MNRMRMIWLLLSILALMLIPACSRIVDTDAPLDEEIPQSPETAAETIESTDASADEPSTRPTISGEVPDPLNNLLNLRSVIFTLSAIRPDGSVTSISVETDEAGNRHITYTQPAIKPADTTEGVTLPEESRSYDIYVVDGSAYAKLESAWTAYSAGDDFAILLSNQLHALEGFTTWLDLLPMGSLTADGSEMLGGFSTDSYAINGSIDGENISGELWFDQATHALVNVELHIPAVLSSNPANPESGEVSITLSAEQAEIPPIALPVE